MSTLKIGTPQADNLLSVHGANHLSSVHTRITIHDGSSVVFVKTVAFIAAIARDQGMNANVLHRWLKLHERNGCHQFVTANSSGSAALTSPASAPAFIALKLPTGMQETAACDIKVELRKGAVSMILTWPTSAAGGDPWER